MILENLTNRGATPALMQTLSYTESRHKMIAENVANWNVPGYKTKQLDAKSFQKSLRVALDEKGSSWRKPLQVRGREFESKAGNYLTVTPSELPPDNVLFHDGTNGSIERMMSDMAENAMVQQAAATILRGNFEGMRKAIRGRL